MEAYAIHKGAIIKPRLARMTMDLVRGKDVESARNILETTNTKASRMILKVLNSAVSNAVNNNGMNENRHDKRTSHIKVVVTDNKEEGDAK